MAEPEPTEDTGDDPPPRKSKLPLILGLVLSIAGGAGGFYSVQSGLLFGDEPADGQTAGDMPAEKIAEMPDVVFVPVDPLVVPVGTGSAGNYLRFRAQLEVGGAYQREVETLMPRVVDVLNSYLRALEPSDLTDGSMLLRIRAQMLRRVQIVTGGDRVKDLLIMEFVIN